MVALVVVERVEVKNERTLKSPEKVLLSANAVEDAALIVIAAVPSKLTPLIALGVASWVALAASPAKVEEMFEKMFTPENVLLSPRRVEEAEEPPVIQTPRIEKQPEVMLIPLANEEEAVVEVAV